MDPGAIRKQLEEVKAALARNEEEHDVLLSLLRGYEGWLRLNPDQAPQLSLSLEPKKVGPPKSRSSVKGTTSLRGAVLRVLQESRGEPINVREILVRARDLGAETDAKNPLGAVDLMVYSLARNHPIFKVGPRLWQYIPPPVKSSGALISAMTSATGHDNRVDPSATVAGRLTDATRR
jgi:hypothetical protein